MSGVGTSKGSWVRSMVQIPGYYVDSCSWHQQLKGREEWSFLPCPPEYQTFHFLLLALTSLILKFLFLLSKVFTGCQWSLMNHWIHAFASVVQPLLLFVVELKNIHIVYWLICIALVCFCCFWFVCVGAITYLDFGIQKYTVKSYSIEQPDSYWNCVLFWLVEHTLNVLSFKVFSGWVCYVMLYYSSYRKQLILPIAFFTFTNT